MVLHNKLSLLINKHIASTGFQHLKNSTDSITLQYEIPKLKKKYQNNIAMDPCLLAQGRTTLCEWMLLRIPLVIIVGLLVVVIQRVGTLRV